MASPRTSLKSTKPQNRESWLLSRLSPMTKSLLGRHGLFFPRLSRVVIWTRQNPGILVLGPRADPWPVLSLTYSFFIHNFQGVTGNGNKPAWCNPWMDLVDILKHPQCHCAGDFFTGIKVFSVGKRNFHPVNKFINKESGLQSEASQAWNRKVS